MATVAAFNTITTISGTVYPNVTVPVGKTWFINVTISGGGGSATALLVNGGSVVSPFAANQNFPLALVAGDVLSSSSNVGYVYTGIQIDPTTVSL